MALTCTKAPARLSPPAMESNEESAVERFVVVPIHVRVFH